MKRYIKVFEGYPETRGCGTTAAFHNRQDAEAAGPNYERRSIILELDWDQLFPSPATNPGPSIRVVRGANEMVR